MEQDPTAIVSLWQLYKLAKAFNMSVGPPAREPHDIQNYCKYKKSAK